MERTPEQNRCVSRLQQMTMTRLLKIAEGHGVALDGKVPKKKLVQILGETESVVAEYGDVVI